MTIKHTQIYQIENLAELTNHLLTHPNLDELREQLFSEFLTYAKYTNASEWNKAVRLCECLAIIGWGSHEPLEAIKTQSFNGNPNTFFINGLNERRFVEAIWSKRTTGYTMESGRTFYYHSPEQIDKQETIAWDYPTVEDIQDIKLNKQQNWVAKNPIRIMQSIGNCYANSKSLIESINNDLQPMLNSKMQFNKYGQAVNKIIIRCSFSYYDHENCKTNHIIADEKLKLKKKDFYPTLLTMFSEEEIKRQGYYLRNRYEYGAFQSKTGKMKVSINFEKEFSELTPQQQKQKFAELLSTAIQTVVIKLKKKKLDYDFDLMMSDFEMILSKWKNCPL